MLNTAASGNILTAVSGRIIPYKFVRIKLGAAQNRLEHSIASLTNYGENLTAAESRIRDADIAKEFMELTKLEILSQTSSSMTAQAMSAPETVLRLLQG